MIPVRSVKQKISIYLKIQKEISRSRLQEYINKVEKLLAEGEKTQEDVEFVEDFFSTINSSEELKRLVASLGGPIKREDVASTANLLNISNLDTSENYEDTMTDKITIEADQLADAVAKMNLQNLVETPEDFFGSSKTDPKRWLDAYESAANTNKWNDETKAFYISHYMKGHGEAFYEQFIAPDIANLPSKSKWKVIKDIIGEFLLGSKSKQKLQSEIDSMHQRINQDAIDFISVLGMKLRQYDETMSEENKVMRIRSKLLRKYHAPLATFNIKTVKELTSATYKIEQGFKDEEVAERHSKYPGSTNEDNAQRTPRGRFRRDYGKTYKPNYYRGNNSYKGPSKEYANKRNYKTNNYRDRARKPYSPGENGNQTSKRPPITCYRCGESGHIAPNCTKPANTKPQYTKNHTNMVQKTYHETKEEPLNKVRTISHVHAVVYNVNESKDVNSKNSNDESPNHHFHWIEVNNVKLRALIDTGALTTLMNEKVVINNKWKVEQNNQTLVGAGGNKLNIIGSCKVEITIKIGKLSKSIYYMVTIVRDLGTNLLFGRDLIKEFNIIINPNDSLEFCKLPLRGIRAPDNCVIEGKTEKIVQANVYTTGPIMVVPNKYNDTLMIANSIDEVVNNTIQVLFINYGETTVKIAENEHIATCETISTQAIEENYNNKKTKNNNNTSDINLAIELKELDEKIYVGDQLGKQEINDLKAILETHVDAFAINGSCGQTIPCRA